MGKKEDAAAKAQKLLSVKDKVGKLPKSSKAGGGLGAMSSDKLDMLRRERGL